MSDSSSEAEEEIIKPKPSAPPKEPLEYEPVAYGGNDQASPIGYNVRTADVPKYVPIVDNFNDEERAQIRQDEELARELQRDVENQNAQQPNRPRMVYVPPARPPQQSDDCCKKCCGVFWIMVTLLMTLAGIGLAAYGGINLIKLDNGGAFMGGGIACATLGFIAMVWACIGTCVCFRRSHQQQQQFQYNLVAPAAGNAPNVNVHVFGGGGEGGGGVGLGPAPAQASHNVHDSIRRANEERRRMEERNRQQQDMQRRQQEATRRVFDNQRQMFERQRQLDCERRCINQQNMQRTIDNNRAMARQQQQNVFRMNQQANQQRIFQQQHNQHNHHHRRF